MLMSCEDHDLLLGGVSETTHITACCWNSAYPTGGPSSAGIVS